MLKMIISMLIALTILSLLSPNLLAQTTVACPEVISHEPGSDYRAAWYCRVTWGSRVEQRKC